MTTLFPSKPFNANGASVAPIKRLGQNFLVDKTAIRKIINSADLQGGDAVLEIGPGAGALTKIIGRKAKKAIAIEKDARMVEILKKKLVNYENVKIIEGDILKIIFQFPENYKIIANLPFYITSPVIRKFLESANPPEKMILVIQKELAQRICAKPPAMNILAVSVQIYSKPKIIDYISKTAFWPKPKVDAAILEIAGIKKIFGENFMEAFFKIVKAGFSHPRKQISNNFLSLKSSSAKLNKKTISAWLLANKIQPSQRAETLSINDWINLTKTL